MHNSGSPAFTKDSDKVAYASRVADQKQEAPFSPLLSQVVILAKIKIAKFNTKHKSLFTCTTESTLRSTLKSRREIMHKAPSITRRFSMELPQTKHCPNLAMQFEMVRERPVR